MNHALRNSLILLLILCCVIAFYYSRNKKAEKDIVVAEASLESTLNELKKYENKEPNTMILDYYRALIEYLEDWTTDNSKYFLQQDNTRISWLYTQEIIKRFNPNFQYNFATVVKGGANEYTITGVSRLADLNAFINYIEGLGALYTIENFNLNPQFVESDTGPVNDMNYSLVIKPWVDASKGKDILNTPFKRVSFSPLAKDPFRPAIHPPMVDPVQERFPNHADLRLVSFTKGMAFFLTPQNQTLTLKPNQAVAYGYFSHIDSNNRAVFRINRTGFYDTVYKNLEQ